MPADRFAKEHLFDWLGISDFYWNRFENRVIAAGGGLFLRPRDMAKIGLLVLNEGNYNGQQVVSKAWVAMTIAFIGITVMVIEGLEAGSALGTITGFAAACGFSIFSECLRWRKETPQFATVALAGFLCAIVTAGILFVQSDSVLMLNRNIYLSMVHGTLIGVG